MRRQQRTSTTLEPLEQRRLFAWANYARLVNQDDAAADFPTLTGKGLAVAVIDTGIDYSQASLGGGFGTGKKVVAGYDFYANDADPMDEDGHGTAVAGVIAAKPYTVNGITYQGIAPDANLVALRVGTEDNISYTNIEKALQWIITNYATYKIVAVNLSLGQGNYTDPETDATVSDEFKTLHDLGIFVAAASGNSNDEQSGPISEDGVSFPAADPNVFAVGAVSASDIITTWSQRGDELDLLAPGENIVMPKKGGGFVTEDGTSFASPYVAGAAALIKQAWSGARAGDIGSILMSSGKINRDGNNETGNTTGLLFARLDIDAALTLTTQRIGRASTFNLGSTFDTVLDSNGVLHAAYYDPVKGDLLYATRSIKGYWSNKQIIDSTGVVGSQLSIAIDPTGKVGIGYFDGTNTAIKFASFNGTAWSKTTVESTGHVGAYPSLAFSIDGDAYLAYYQKTSGDLKLAHLTRDTNQWERTVVDAGTSGANVGSFLSLDVGEAAFRSGFFTQYDTTVAIAYADSTNGDLKYARLDVDDVNATWFVAIVDNTTGVSGIDLNLHAGPTTSGLQAQISYRENKTGQVKYAYRLTDWFTEPVVASNKISGNTQIYFTDSNQPVVTFYLASKQAIFSGTRISSGNWAYQRLIYSSGPTSVTLNERSGDAILTSLNRTKVAVASKDLL